MTPASGGLKAMLESAGGSGGSEQQQLQQQVEHQRRHQETLHPPSLLQLPPSAPVPIARTRANPIAIPGVSASAAPLNFVPVESGLPPLVPPSTTATTSQHQQPFAFPPFHHGQGHFRFGVAASAPDRFGVPPPPQFAAQAAAAAAGAPAAAAAAALPPHVVSHSPGSELSTAFTLACDIFDEIDGRTAAAAAAAAGVPPFEVAAAASAPRPFPSAPSLAGIGEERERRETSADDDEKLRGLDFDFDDADGGGAGGRAAAEDDDEMLLAALDVDGAGARPMSGASQHTHHPFASSSYTPGSAGPLADSSYGSTGDELGGGFGGRSFGNGGGNNGADVGGPSSLASSSYGGLGASGAHFAALRHSPAGGAAAAAAAATATAALRRVQSAAAMSAVPPFNSVGGIGSGLAAAAAAADGGFAALSAAGGLPAPPSSARTLSSSAPRSGARGPRHGIGLGGGAGVGGRNPLSVSSSPSLKALSSSLGRNNEGSFAGPGSLGDRSNGSGATTPYGSFGAQPSRSGRISRPPRRALGGFSDDEGDGAGGGLRGGLRSGSGSYGSLSSLVAGRKHSSWSIRETEALVLGVETCGGGRWAEIKKLNLPDLAERSAVDLKDKWRNLARLIALPTATPRTVAVSSSPGPDGGGGGGGGGAVERRRLPAELLDRVRALLPTSPSLPYGRITPSRVPGARRKR